jgi:hypothetical protein
MSSESLLQIIRQAGRQSQIEWMVLIVKYRGIDAPKRGEVSHIGLMRKATAVVLANLPQRFPSGNLAKNYDEPRVDTDVLPAEITSKTIQLAVPEYTSPSQWLYLNLGIGYGRRRGVWVVITRIRE